VSSLEVVQLNTTLRGTLAGTVKDSAGAALPGITVTARVDGGGQGQLTTTSATDGSWAFTNLDVGAGRPYSVSFSDPAGTYLPLDYDADPSTPATREMVRVVAGQTTTADAVLRRSAQLTGTVHNTAGDALAGIVVRARRDGNAQGELMTVTAADGSFAFRGLQISTVQSYSVSFSDPAGVYLPLDYDADPATPADLDMVEVAAGGTATADAVMRRSCTLSGIVTDSRTGAPVAGVRIEPVLAPGQPPKTGPFPVSAGVTDAAGAYTLTGIPDGVYVLACQGKPPVYGLQYWPAAGTAAAATPIELTPSAPTAVADVVLQRDSTRPVTKALKNVTTRRKKAAKFAFRVTDAYGGQAKLTLLVATAKGKIKARVKLGVRRINVADSAKWKPARLAAGRYTWWVTATDLAGNTQSKAVKKALVVKR